MLEDGKLWWMDLFYVWKKRTGKLAEMSVFVMIGDRKGAVAAAVLLLVRRRVWEE
jgi:hypothetical protein